MVKYPLVSGAAKVVNGIGVWLNTPTPLVRETGSVRKEY